MLSRSGTRKSRITIAMRAREFQQVQWPSLAVSPWFFYYWMIMRGAGHKNGVCCRVSGLTTLPNFITNSQSKYARKRAELYTVCLFDHSLCPLIYPVKTITRPASPGLLFKLTLEPTILTKEIALVDDVPDDILCDLFLPAFPNRP